MKQKTMFISNILIFLGIITITSAIEEILNINDYLYLIGNENC